MHKLIISPEIAKTYPQYGCVVGYATNLGISNHAEQQNIALSLLRGVEEQVLAAGADCQHPHIAAWREAYRSFGAKPKRHHCSVEALLSRVLERGTLPDINPVVNLYNKVSLQYMIPVGGEDWDALTSDNVLRFAEGTESFGGIRGGEPIVEAPEKGEVVWADCSGVTCRRWNWRQCRRTAVTGATTAAYFVFDVLPPFGLSTAVEAAQCLGRDLQLISKAHFHIDIIQLPSR